MFFVIVVNSTVLFAQVDTNLSNEKNVKLLFGLDANRSFVLKNKTKFNGVRIGVEIRDRHKLGLGFYGLQEPIIMDRSLDENKFPNSNDSVLFNFNYNGFFYEYVWFHTKRWELSTPINFGGGRLDMSYRDTVENKRIALFNGKTSVFVTSGAVEYKLLRWLALGSGVGYRFTFSRDENLIKGLNAPIYVYRVKILMGELVKMWFKKDYVNKEWD